MSLNVKVDTTNVDSYISTLNNLMGRATSLDTNIINYARIKEYKTIYNNMCYLGSPADYTWRLKKVSDHLSTVKTNTINVEDLLKKIDPLNYEASVKRIENQNAFLQSLDKTIAKGLGKFGIVGSIINFIYTAHNVDENDQWGTAFSITKSCLRFYEKYL